MKTILNLITIISITIFLSACGRSNGLDGEPGSKGDKGDPGEVIIIDNTDPFVGEYYLPFAGFVIININHENEHSVDVQLDSENPDNSICSLTLDSNTIDEHDNKIVYTGNVSMSVGNCRSDNDVALLTVSGTTYQYKVTLQFNEDDLMEAKLLVFQIVSGVKTLVINRTLTEES